MRKNNLITILLALMSAVVVTAQTRFVGHRGSIWGVENTREAFINGANAGYDYLECDLRVTADGTLVLSHDETTSRMGGNLTVAESTIEQLKAENYSQTRNGNTYNGSICTLAEYLDICAEYNVLPVIELKWSTGINNNDCSNIYRLVELLETKGFRKKCVILTSMRDCLDYIHKNYPDLQLQFLAKTDCIEMFDQCTANNMDVDIRRDCVDQSIIDLYHAAGRLVNVWTVNDINECRKLIEMGCDFITTDSIQPSEIKK